jgi:hypothetical protein
MSKLHINIGDTANDRTGDPLRTAFDKVNQNFDELYARTGDDIQIPALTGNGGKVLTTNGTTLSWSPATTNKLVNGSTELVFDANGILNFPNNNGQIGQLESPYTGLEFRTGSGADWIGISYGEINDNNISYFYFDKDGNNYLTANHRAHLQIKNPAHDGHVEWLFESDGALTLPAGSTIEEAVVITSGGSTSFTIATDFQSQIDVGGSNIGVANTVENQQIVAGWTITFADGVTTRVANLSTGNSGPGGEYLISFDTPVTLEVGFPITVSGPSGGGSETLNLKLTPATGVSWSFGTDGVLTLPNGSTIGDGEAGFGVPITTARGTILLGNLAECAGGESHFHIMKAGQQDIDLFLGDDSNYVKLPSTGGVEISSSEIGGQHYWTFGTDGNLTLPQGGIIKNQVLVDVVLQPYTQYPQNGVYYTDIGLPYLSNLWTPGLAVVLNMVNPTGDWAALNGGTFYISHVGGELVSLCTDAGLTTPINVTAGTYDSGTLISLASDSRPYVSIQSSGSNNWTFGNDGTTSFPNNAITTSNTPLTIQTKLPATYGPFNTAYFESGNGSVNGVHPGTYAGYFSITTVNINNDGTYSVSGYPASIQNGTNPTYTISGVDLGGTSPANDCLLTVTTVNDIITNVVVSGTALLPKWTFGTDGTLTLPNYSKQIDTNTITCDAGADTVIYTSSGPSQMTIKLLLKIEGIEGVNGTEDTQSTEMIVAKGNRNNNVAASVYGLVYTSESPLATFTARWNEISNRVEVLCRPTSLSNAVEVKTFAVEIATSH